MASELKRTPTIVPPAVATVYPPQAQEEGSRVNCPAGVDRKPIRLSSALPLCHTRRATPTAEPRAPHLTQPNETHATDTPGNDKKTQGEIKCGGGPVLFRGPNINPRVFDVLEETAKAHEIPRQVRGVPRATGTDANAIQISREGVACGLIGIPNRYMHSPVEVVHLEDLDRAAQLLAEFCLALTPQMDWTP